MARDLLNNRWVRILSVSFVMYTVAFIDRTNIAMALPQMSRQLGLDPREAGQALGIFFWGYLLFQVPGGYLAQRWSAKWVVAILMSLWGAASILTGFVRTVPELWVMRFLLGLTEGGVWPAVLVLIAHWFPRAELARANAYWMLCLPVSVVVSSPVSGWLLSHWNWRILLIVEGAFPFLWLIPWMLAIDDLPENAPWLSAEERDRLRHAIAADSLGPKQATERLWTTLIQPQVLVLTLIYFLRNCGSYGSLFWLPTAVTNAAKVTSLSLGWLVAIPYVIGSIGMVVVAKSSDRWLERRWHAFGTMVGSGVFILAAVGLGARFPISSFACLSIGNAGIYASLGPFWALPSETLAPASVAVAFGVINAFGNLGGYLGPVIVGYCDKRFGDFNYGFAVLGVVLIAAGALTLVLRSGQKQRIR
jgi:MFS family permease